MYPVHFIYALRFENKKYHVFYPAQKAFVNGFVKVDLGKLVFIQSIPRILKTGVQHFLRHSYIALLNNQPRYLQFNKNSLPLTLGD